MEPIYRIGITGHRKLLEKRSEVMTKTFDLLKLKQTQHPKIEVNTGMALGFDQLVCEVCIALSVPFVAVVPCDNQDLLWSVPQKENYSNLLSQAIRVVQVSPGSYEPWKMFARNGWIVNNSDEMIVHWDGFYQGGTGGCMKLVKSKKLPWQNTFNSLS